MDSKVPLKSYGRPTIHLCPNSAHIPIKGFKININIALPFMHYSPCSLNIWLTTKSMVKLFDFLNPTASSLLP